MVLSFQQKLRSLGENVADDSTDDDIEDDSDIDDDSEEENDDTPDSGIVVSPTVTSETDGVTSQGSGVQDF